MSSVAVHAAIHQPSLQYQQASPPLQSYQQHLPDLTTPSPSAARKQSRNSGGNASTTDSPQQPSHRSPPALSATTSPRAQPLPASSYASPPKQASAAAYDHYYADSPSAHSVHQQSQQYNSPASGYTNSPAATRSAQPSVPASYEDDSDGDYLTDEPEPALTNSAAPHSRGQNQSRQEPESQYNSPNSSRSQPQRPSPDQTHDNALPRENSTIINRLVIDDPQDDVQRERARIAESRPVPAGTDVTPITGLGLVGSEGVDDGGRGAHKSRQEHLKSSHPRKETKFGEYILGQTVGEGEFGKVKMGWKKEGGVQVAIKLIRRETLGNNPNRLPKIYREIAILRGLQHPNIVRLHEMVETERHIGIILEYASGGELFDYILNHRYLKDNAARRLFAQLVSGVGYLHKKGIVHRDLKLENLLLDRNRNIIITDFGFANTFNPGDELGDEIEYNLSSRDFVQKMNLDHVQTDGHRRGDLMQTSCGSPCYAAPELVVSDSLYTGRKVDVWSCGVILYAMLAGYLPFDDDPANPEGDNINLLYKYIVSTPLTFPEYVTPHARDLLRRILVPDPRKRADLFEVARHSWLSEYAHVVGFITSSTTTTTDIANSTIPSQDVFEAPGLGRSVSVREPAKASPSPVSSAAMVRGHTNVHATEEAQETKSQRDAKRRTVQLEYVAPQSQTARAEPIATSVSAIPQPVVTVAAPSKARPRPDSVAEPADFAPTSAYSTYQPPAAEVKTQPRSTTHSEMLPPVRHQPPRSVSDFNALSMSPVTSPRPSTGGSGIASSRLNVPSRGNSYSRPVAATVAPTNAEGRFSQPAKSGYIIAGSLQADGRDPVTGRPLSQHLPATYQVQPVGDQDRPGRPGHRRTSTIESITSRIFGRSSSSRRQSQQEGAPSRQENAVRPEKASRAYPPVSMRNAVPNDGDMPRQSTDSHRNSFGFSRKSADMSDKRSSRRFSFLPQALSRMSLSSTRNDEPTVDNRQLSAQPVQRNQQQSKQGMAFSQRTSPSASDETTGSTIPVLYDSAIDRRHRQQPASQPVQRGATAPNLLQHADQSSQRPQAQQQYSQQAQRSYSNYGPMSERPISQIYKPTQPQDSYSSGLTSQATQQQQAPQHPRYPPGFNTNDSADARASAQKQQTSVLHKNNNRKFGEAYETSGTTSGSSGGARRVMDWFRKRGRERMA